MISSSIVFEAGSSRIEVDITELLDGTRVNESDLRTSIREICELSLFHISIEGGRWWSGKAIIQRAQRHAARIIGRETARSLEAEIGRHVGDEVSSLLRRAKEAKAINVRYLLGRETSTVVLPLSAFSTEVRRRIFDFLAAPMNEQLDELRERRSQIHEFEKQFQTSTRLIDELRRQFGVRHTASREDRETLLKASLGELQKECDRLKKQLADAPESDDTTRVERRLKERQRQRALLASELQTLLRTG